MARLLFVPSNAWLREASPLSTFPQQSCSRPVAKPTGRELRLRGAAQTLHHGRVLQPPRDPAATTIGYLGRGECPAFFRLISEGFRAGFRRAVVVVSGPGGDPMPTEYSADLFGFAPVEGRAVVAGFDGGKITTDAGALLLGATDRAIRLVGGRNRGDSHVQARYARNRRGATFAATFSGCSVLTSRLPEKQAGASVIR